LAELSIKRALFGYRTRDTDALVAARDAELDMRAAELRVQFARVGELEAVAESLTLRLVERERELSEARDQLDRVAEANEHGAGLVESLARRVEELHSQARGQATRIRLAALKDAVVVTSRVRADGNGPDEPAERPAAVEVPIRRVAARAPAPPEIVTEVEGSFALSQNGVEIDRAETVLAGSVKVNVGPLADFAQLIRIEDAAKSIEAASDISIQQFSGGRATLSMHLAEPVELLRELEERADLEFKVRRAGDDELVLDVGDGGHG